MNAVPDMSASAVPDRRSWIYLALLTMIWGASFYLIAISLTGFSFGFVAAGRVTLAAVALVGVLLATGRRVPAWGVEWAWCAAIGIVGLAGPFMLQSWAIRTVPSSMVALYLSAIPILVLLLSRIIFRDYVSPLKWLGFVLGTLGLALLTWSATGGGTLEFGGWPGQVACLTAALCYAMAAQIVRAMPHVPPLPATAATHISASVVLLPVGISEFPVQVPPWGPVLALLMLGLVQTGLAQYMRMVTVRRAGPVFVSTVGFLIPVWAGILGVGLLGETVTPGAVASYVLILGGVYLARSRKPRAS